MKASILYKRLFSSFYLRSGRVDKTMRRFRSDRFYLVLMYHRIIPADNLIQPGMYVSPETFEKHLVYLIKYFNVIPLSHLNRLKALEMDSKNAKPLCVLTFDDGWIDFYENAFPLLKKYHQPATVFLPTAFVGSRKQFWTDRFSFLLLNRQYSTRNLDIAPDILAIVDSLARHLKGSFPNQLEEGINYLKKYPLSTIDHVLDELSAIWHVKTTDEKRSFLNWPEISEMKASGLISFGSHTVNHQILTTLNDVAIMNELTDSLQLLLKKKVIDSSCISFCYPNGNYTNRISDIVRESGYHLAMTTRNGWNHPEADKYTLKRVGIHEDMSSTNELFSCRIAGLI